MHIITKAALLQRPREVIERLILQYDTDEATQALVAVNAARERQATLLTRILSGQNINLTLIALDDDDKFLLSIGVNEISRQRDHKPLHPLVVEMFNDNRAAFDELKQVYPDGEVADATVDGIMAVSRAHELLNMSAHVDPDEVREWQRSLSRRDFLLMDLAAIKFKEMPYAKLTCHGLVGRD